jgi:trehalose 2-sulfotransferase
MISDNPDAESRARLRGYAICTTPRSGSNYLCELLTSTRSLGRPLEYFNPQGRRALETPDYPDDRALQLQRIVTQGCTPNGVYSLKVFPNQLERTLADVAVFNSLPSLRFVRLMRSDLLGQAISWARALMTGQYRSYQPTTGSPSYDGALISRCLANLACANAEWDIYFARRGITPTCLYYEDLEIDADASVRTIAELMNVEVALPSDSAVSVRIQRDMLNETWRRAYIEEYGAANVMHRVTAPHLQIPTL